MIYFLTSSGGSSANSPQSNGGVIYHDEETEKKISLLLYARLIHAVNDICPFTGENQGEYADEKPEPYLYWKDGMEATSTLIKRYVFGVVTCCIFLPDVILSYGKNLKTPQHQKHTSLWVSLSWLCRLFLSGHLFTKNIIPLLLLFNFLLI